MSPPRLNKSSAKHIKHKPGYAEHAKEFRPAPLACACPLYPQQRTPPVLISAHVVAQLQLMAATPLSTLVSDGVFCVMFIPSPNCIDNTETYEHAQDQLKHPARTSDVSIHSGSRNSRNQSSHQQLHKQLE
jgi:hypothetical protein